MLCTFFKCDQSRKRPEFVKDKKRTYILFKIRCDWASKLDFGYIRFFLDRRSDKLPWICIIAHILAILEDAIFIASIVHFIASFFAFNDFRIASHVDSIFAHLAAVAVYPIFAVVITRFHGIWSEAVVVESRFRLVSRIITPCLATELSDCFINLRVRNLTL